MTKFSGMDSLPIFFTHGAALLRALHTQELRYEKDQGTLKDLLRDGKANKLRSPSSSAGGNSEFFLEQHHTNIVVIINNFINIYILSGLWSC